MVPRAVIEHSWHLLAETGRQGFESSLVWIGLREGDDLVNIESLFRPAQIARRHAEGVSVEVTAEGMSELVMSLPPDRFVAVRLHTHPGRAYHSEVDDQNMLISHPGESSSRVVDEESHSGGDGPVFGVSAGCCDRRRVTPLL